ncbi:glutamine-hydrolyzing carbamoyl-phosphate synthase small subunit [Candidatus Woesearchaeota archaeon]|nr:glutamine-hydrolyzing carbamoyl-phosphate synthase small subunit [Candidatus Woesearchaeota archaeon]
MDRKAKLVLEDGTEFEGFSFGHENSISGEVVFNTGMVGYPQSFTDPSYRGQILVLTYPLIGNYGVPGAEKDDYALLSHFESDRIQISGLIIDDYCEKPSHWGCKKTLSEWLKENRVPALRGMDTRALTKKLRHNGVMLGKIIFEKDIPFEDQNKRNLVAEVTIKEPLEYNEGAKSKIILVDTGAKNNIVRELVKRNLYVKRVPFEYDFSEECYDGIFISNGPGNPKTCKVTIENIKKALSQDKPVFGICLGNQILALAAGANTYKLKFGHRSQNQPCVLEGTRRCFITSQNHGFAVDAKSLPNDWEEWFVNANDGTNEGIRHRKKPFMSVQFHPEATPGPVDTNFLFDKFAELVKK